jgi:hypothetical protein
MSVGYLFLNSYNGDVPIISSSQIASGIYI